MRAYQLLAVLLASVLIITFAAILVNKDVFQPEYRLQPFLNIRDVDVRPTEVTSALVTLNITAYLNHAGGETTNASMLIRAIRSDTKLLAEQVSAPIPQIPETQSDKIIKVSQELKVERSGGYELRILLFNNGSLLDSGSVSVAGLSALVPQTKRSGIVLNNIDFTVSGVSAGRVTIKSDIYLENRGPEASENLKLIVKAKEADSNLLADKKDSETGVIASETTAVKSVNLEVPDNYNYMVVVELWKGDVLINTWEKPVLLAPTKTVPKESVEKKVDIEVSKFIREEGAPPGAIGGAPAGEQPVRKEPGFEVLAAIVALMFVIALRRRS
ncbi:MAG TPA: hypothetical protein VJJ51_14995 [Candidatus Methanoperedens sp.]|nr:PGF-CTERM sorting domain-containing protein [Candidatus Methanoperedens sp.]HLB72349.1 hypothetical protein [Candidatus Methanoperedens sp.]